MLILVLSFWVALLDQTTKYLVMAALPIGGRIPVIPGLFNLSHVRNTGAAWGMMQGANAVLVAVSVVMLTVILGFRRKFFSEGVGSRWAAGFMVGGIAGNLIDRVRLGYVVDFLDAYWEGHHFPSFNVADSAICTGVGLYILIHVLQVRRESPAAPPAGQGTGPLAGHGPHANG